MPTLILLGAAGGVLRGVVDFYIQFANWRSARSAHLREQPPGREIPRLTRYFDPVVDLAAAGVHSVMGAGLAVLFGSTGQISGPYAAIVVGISAPVLLTQLARIQSVSEALGGGAGDPGQQGVAPAAQAALPEQGVTAVNGTSPAGASPVVPQPGPEPQPNGRPVDPPPAGPGRGHGGREVPRLRGEPAVGEEGRP